MSTPVDPPLSRRAARQAEQSAHAPHEQAFAQPTTRRERGGTPVSVPSSAPTDVAYRTQVRPRVPYYDAPPAAHTVIPGAPPVGESASAAAPSSPLVGPPPPAAPLAPSATDAPVRRRDFRPPAEQQPAPPAAPPGTDGIAPAPARLAAPGDQGYDTELEYHTQLAPRRDAPPAPPTTPPAAPPVFEVPLLASSPHEQTLSRRELRALREQLGQETAASPAESPAPSAPPVTTAPPATAAPSAPPPAAAPSMPPAALVEPAAVPTSTGASAAVGSAPTGSHWSVGIHADDDPLENTYSREVGSTSAVTSTNALVLPEMPTASIAGPVTGTGEIIITGMIDLPRTVSSTGTVPTVHDSPDIDDLFDAGDLAAAPPDAAPVSASRAVSSHTQAHSIIAPTNRRPSSNTVTTVLVGATVVMAVVAIGLFVLAAVNGLF